LKDAFIAYIFELAVTRMTNRNYIAILFLLATLSCEQTTTKSINVKSLSQNQQNNFQEKIKFTAIAGKWDTTNNKNNLLVKCQLANSSSDSFSYIVMSCYYPFNYQVQPKEILSKDWEGCDGNEAEIITIPPKKTFEATLTLPIKTELNLKHISSFRISVSLIASKSFYKESNPIIFFNIKDYYPNLTDTIYKVKTGFTLIKNHGVTTIDSLGELHILWSNQIKL
jgi:hypothetical protein